MPKRSTNPIRQNSSDWSRWFKVCFFRLYSVVKTCKPPIGAPLIFSNWDILIYFLGVMSRVEIPVIFARKCPPLTSKILVPVRIMTKAAWSSEISVPSCITPSLKANEIAWQQTANPIALQNLLNNYWKLENKKNRVGNWVVGFPQTLGSLEVFSGNLHDLNHFIIFIPANPRGELNLSISLGYGAVTPPEN